MPEIKVNTERVTDMDNPQQFNASASGNSSTSNYAAWNIDQILTYTKDFGKHHMDFMLGYTREKTNSNGLSIGFSGFDTPTNLAQYNLSTATEPVLNHRLLVISPVPITTMRINTMRL